MLSYAKPHDNARRTHSLSLIDLLYSQMKIFIISKPYATLRPIEFLKNGHNTGLFGSYARENKPPVGEQRELINEAARPRTSSGQSCKSHEPAESRPELGERSAGGQTILRKYDHYPHASMTSRGIFCVVDGFPSLRA